MNTGFLRGVVCGVFSTTLWALFRVRLTFIGQLIFESNKWDPNFGTAHMNQSKLDKPYIL